MDRADGSGNFTGNPDICSQVCKSDVCPLNVFHFDSRKTTKAVLSLYYERSRTTATWSHHLLVKNVRWHFPVYLPSTQVVPIGFPWTTKTDISTNIVCVYMDVWLCVCVCICMFVCVYAYGFLVVSVSVFTDVWLLCCSVKEIKFVLNRYPLYIQVVFFLVFFIFST